MFKLCRHNVYISQKSCFTFKTKISTGQLSNLLLLAHLSEHSWQISPPIYSAFSSVKTWTVPPIASWQCTTNDWGYVSSSEPQTLRQCLNFIDVILQIPICYRRRNRKRNTNKKIHVQVHFTVASQFYVHVNVKFYMHVFMCWKKKAKLDRAEQ